MYTAVGALESHRAGDALNAHLEIDGQLFKLTLMKSEQPKLGRRATGSRAYDQVEVAWYVHFLDAVAACDQANREHTDRHYVMKDSGKEFYAGTRVD